MGERLKGKVAIVTGAGSIGPGWGNGKAAAVLYAREGARVVAADIKLDAAEETRDIIRGEGGVCEAVACDVSRDDQVKALIGASVDAFGTVHVLHNNVGIAETGGPVQVDEASWDRVMAINLKSAYLTCHHCLPVMEGNEPDEHRQRGAIVNISSVAGIRWSGVSYITYATSKGALIPFTRSVALEYAPKGIRANCVLPGLMNTPMVHQAVIADEYGADADAMVAARDAQCPTGKMGDAWDVAYASLFLACHEGRYVTGTELIVDGGLTAKFS